MLFVVFLLKYQVRQGVSTRIERRIFLMPVIDYNAWVDEDVYMEEMAKMHKLDPKLRVIETLLREFQRLQTIPETEMPATPRQWLLTELSGQIVALALELTDDLAAVCASYLKGARNHDNRVMEWLSKFNEGGKFYNRLSKDASFACEAVGLDAACAPSHEVETVKERFRWVCEMRNNFWKWYTGYKHGQYATPIVLTMKTPEGAIRREWGLYLIPRPLRRQAGKVHTEDRFINTVDNVGIFYKLAMECVSLSIEARDRHYPKVFGHNRP
jgi:hypothetical protein